MLAAEILHEVHLLGLYTPEEWQEYLACFDDAVVREVGSESDPRPDEPELLRRIRSSAGAPPVAADIEPSPKNVKIEDLATEQARGGMTLAVVSGAFDLLHLGHVRCMQYARECLAGQPDARLCAMALSDSHIREKKGEARPILNVRERLAMLAAVRLVDYAVVLGEPNCLAAIERLRPQFFFKSPEDLAQDIVRREADLVRTLGGQLVLCPAAKIGEVSTTSLVDMLGSRFSYPEEQPADGQQNDALRGRTLSDPSNVVRGGRR